MRRRTITITAEDVDCQYCADSRTQGKCSNSICPYIKERIEAGVVTYEEAVLAIIPAGAKMKLRLPALIASYSGTMWIDDHHKNRMDYMNYQLGYVRKRNTPRYYAAMFLLTANDPLCRRTSNCFYHGGVEFDYASLKGIGPHNYTLFQAARGIYSDAKGITPADLADPEVVDDETFRLIINGLLIAKFGLCALKLKKGDNHNG